MDPQDPSEWVAKLHEQRLEARDLRLLTELSYRQIGDWDRRGVLPNSREDPAGWRRFSAWDAIAISVVSTLREEFGIPLNKQERLLWWMLGGLPTHREHLRQHLSEMVLRGTTGKLPAPYDRLVSATVYGAAFANVDPVLLRFPDNDSAREHRPAEVHDASRMATLIDSMVPQLDHTLRERGWPTPAATTFSRSFLNLSFGHRTGTGTYPDLAALRSQAYAMKDESAVRATIILSQALLPLSEIFAIMAAGFPVVLLTDLKQSVFVDSFRHAELTTAGLLAPTTISMRVDTLVAKVLDHIGGEKLVIDLDPATANVHRMRDAQKDIFARIAMGGFKKIVIEPREGEYRIETEHIHLRPSPQDLKRLVRDAPFQTFTGLVREGEIIRIDQRITSTAPAPGTGTTPPRRGPKESG